MLTSLWFTVGSVAALPLQVNTAPPLPERYTKRTISCRSVPVVIVEERDKRRLVAPPHPDVILDSMRRDAARTTNNQCNGR